MGVPEFRPDQAEEWLGTKGADFPFSPDAKAVLDAGGRILGLINFKDTAWWVKSGDDAYLDVVRQCTFKMVRAHKDRIHHWEVKYVEGEQEMQQWLDHLDDQSKYLAKNHVRMLAKGIERIIWYNLTDVNSARAKENFSLLWSAALSPQVDHGTEDK